MKLFHLGDLHIGKRVNGFSLLEDQRYILEVILQLVRRHQPDGVLIAGDIYDKSVPGIEAVQLFDWFLTGLVECRVPVYFISGNHDSAERLAFAADLLKESGVYVSALYPEGTQGICCQDEYGEYCIYLLPFLRPAYVRNAYPQETAEGYPEALRVAVGKLGMDPRKRNILVAHQFVAGAAVSDSEELSVGGLDQIGCDVFDGFDYVALGHIHRPQNAGKTGGKILRYCGSPLKYSFSETEEKSVTVVELKEKGTAPVITLLPLKPKRDMRRLRGTYEELTLRENYEGTNTEDYIQITLTDEEDIVDAAAKLRIIYPNLMQLGYDNIRTRESQDIAGAETAERKSDAELFAELFQSQNNRPLNPEEAAYIQQQLRQIEEEA